MLVGDNDAGLQRLGQNALVAEAVSVAQQDDVAL